MHNIGLEKADLAEAQQHIFIALDEFKPNLPNNHEELIEKLRDYFSDQQVEVFSKIIMKVGEPGFRDFIADTVIESGFYVRGEDGQIRIKA